MSSTFFSVTNFICHWAALNVVHKMWKIKQNIYYLLFYYEYIRHRKSFGSDHRNFTKT
jgi:hypothetical protein